MTTDPGRRWQVWEALSELFLDTEVDVPSVIARLQASGYDRAEIERIMIREVAPVLGGNALSVAGVWTAFDLTPVEQRYLAGQARPSLLGWAALRIIREDWQQVQGALN